MAAILMQPIEMTYAQVRELSITGAVGLQAVLEPALPLCERL